MTRIELTTANQRLINQKKVTLAAGDIDSVFLHIEFDYHWDDFPARSATFYTSNNATVQEMLLLDDICVVPATVLMEKGVLYIGARGISADGEAVKTSSIVKYNIVPGAMAGETTLKPTMNLYQQFLAAMAEGLDPLSKVIENRIQTALEGKFNDLSASVNSQIKNGVRFPDYSDPIGTITEDMQPWSTRENCWIVVGDGVCLKVFDIAVGGTTYFDSNHHYDAIPVQMGCLVETVDFDGNYKSFTAYKMKK